MTPRALIKPLIAVSALAAIGLAVGKYSRAMAGTTAAPDRPLFSQIKPTTEDLGDYQWQHRPVLIFAQSPQDPDYLNALMALERARPALKDRDIVVLTDTDPDANSALRHKLGIDGFRMMLVGKDGTVKMASHEMIDPQTLFDTIDGMPMRKREMSDS